MENFSITLCFALLLLIFTYHSILIIIFSKKRKLLINDYEKLLNLKDWYEKISEEASRSSEHRVQGSRSVSSILP